ncbi:5'-3' exonuclease [Amphibacillus sp. Q70]|uniref:5'-3' exonuclease n=1 Tax=Amphibacillus sp. Q70 TaxID=3453416 RepID=UPI003F85FB24
MREEKLLVIDGFNLLSRGYFATAYNKTEEQLSRNSAGLYTNGLRVFFQKLFNLITEYQTNHLVVAWDVKREDTERRQKYDFYKASRSELAFPLIQQYETLNHALDQLGISQLTIPPHEADDIIGSITQKWSIETAKDCLIYSNDKDFLQLLNPHTSQIMAQKKKEICYTIDHFRDEYGIEPYQWIDVKALLGDPGDNVPGVAGVGEKSALPLIQMYHSVENIYQLLPNLDPKFKRYIKKLIDGEESAHISKELVTINCDIAFDHSFSLNDLIYQPEYEKIRDILGQLEVKVRLN